jgi:hypothetical protein
MQPADHYVSLWTSTCKYDRVKSMVPIRMFSVREKLSLKSWSGGRPAVREEQKEQGEQRENSIKRQVWSVAA